MNKLKTLNEIKCITNPTSGNKQHCESHLITLEEASDVLHTSINNSQLYILIEKAHRAAELAQIAYMYYLFELDLMIDKEKLKNE